MCFDLWKLPRTALVAMLLVGAPAGAQAGVLASGVLLSSNAGRFGCWIRNVGSVPVKVTNAFVATSWGTKVTDFDGCTGTTLSPGQSCSFSGPGNMLAGTATVVGPAKQVRGECMLLASGNNAVVSTPMR
jgi:hypothetical protein